MGVTINEKEYIEEIPKARLITKEDAFQEYNGFIMRLFRTLGFDMEIEYRDDHETNKRVVRARWQEMKNDRPKTNEEE